MLLVQQSKQQLLAMAGQKQQSLQRQVEFELLVQVELLLLVIIL